MNYEQCLQYMAEHCKRNTPGGFMRTQRMAELVGNPQEQLHTIHIAGTNGKGSTAAAVTSMLMQAGYRVGLFTSPHLEYYEERIRISGIMISQEDFAGILSRLITEVIPRLQQENLGHPGEFELLTVAGWLYFAGRTDFVVSEVGLGGTLDPTNLIKHPVLTVITPVSLDHCQILGDTVEQIAGEKAGILKEGVPVIVAPQESGALKRILSVAAEKHCQTIVLHAGELEPVDTNLVGAYQQMNCNTALAAVRNLQQRGVVSITEAQCREGLLHVFWPGRMEQVELEDGKTILLDGAHNGAGIACLAENLRTLYAKRQIVLFLTILDDKEQMRMLQTIVPLVDSIVLTRPEHDERAQHWSDMQQMIRQVAPGISCRVYADYVQGLEDTVRNLEPDQLLCITGSLYLLGDCRHVLRGLGIDLP